MARFTHLFAVLALCCFFFSSATAQQWTWAKTANGLRQDYVSSVQVDAWGGVYCAGRYKGDIDFGQGYSFTGSNSNYIGFIAKYNYNGDLLWVHKVGAGGSDDGCTDVDIDADGFVYVAVNTRSTSWTLGNYTHVGTGNDKSVILKLAPNGAVVWGKKINEGTSNAWIGSIAVRDSFIAVTGSYAYLDMLIGPDTLTHLTSEDIWVARFGTDSGNYHWSAYAQSDYIDYGRHVALDDAGHVYFYGSYLNDLDINGQQTLIHTGSAWSTDYEAVLCRFSNTGQLDWAQQYSGSGSYSTDNLEIGPGNVVYVTGWHENGTHSVGGDNYSVNSSYNMLVQKLDSAGNYLWTNLYLGGSLGRFNGSAIDAQGNLYVGGYLGSTKTFGSYTVSGSSSNYTNFFAKISPSGTVLYAADGGDYCNNFGNDQLAVDPSGAVYYGNAFGTFTGATAGFGSHTVGPTPDVYKDAYIAKHGTSSCTAPTAGFTWSGASLTQTFQASDPSLIYREWDFGTGTTITAAQPTFTFPSPGTYNVCLIADNSCGTDTFCQSVSVACLPVVAAFTSDSLVNASFTDGSAGATSWSWDFGDGAVDSIQHPQHTYADSGTYTICLIATNDCSADTSCQTVHFTCPEVTAGFGSANTLLDVSFTATGTSASAWSWDFGDGSTDSVANPLHAYADTGSYTVCLIITNGCHSDTICQQVDVVCPALNPGFTVSDSLLQATFTDTSNSATSWSWNFGDSSMASVQNPMHTFPDTGTYMVCLVVGNGCFFDTVCQAVVISCPPVVAGFAASDSVLQATFTNSSSNATSWSWDFGDGGQSSSEHPVHNYPGTGTYTVCLIASSSCFSDTSCQSVSVSCAPPVASFTTVDSLYTVAFQSAVSSGATYSWNFGDSTFSSLANPVHQYADTGQHLVCLIVSDSCGSDTVCQFVTVTVPCVLPVAAFSAAASGANTIAFTNASASGSYSWDFGDSTFSSLANPTHQYADTGSYLVCLVVSDSCGNDTVCQLVTVVCPLPVAAFSSAASGAYTVALTNASTGGTYSWDFGDSTFSSLVNPTHQYADTGSYLVCLIVSDSCGSDTVCQLVNVACPLPVAAFTSATSGPYTVAFTNASIGGTYSWDFGDSTFSSLANPTHQYADTGSYLVCLIVSDSCGNDTVCQLVSMTVACPLPVAAFSSAASGPNGVAFTNASVDAIAFSWDFGTGVTDTAANPIHTFDSSGTVVVCLTAINGCGADTSCQNVTVSCPTPVAGFSWADSLLTVTFSNQAQGSDSTVWSFGDGMTSTDNNPVYDYAAYQDYTVCQFAYNTCGIDSVCQLVPLSCALPTADFTWVADSMLGVLFTPASNTWSTLSWDFGDGNSSTDTLPNHTYNSVGTYEVCLTVANICGTDSLCDSVQAVDPLLVSGSAFAQLPVRVWPNPFSSQLTVATNRNLLAQPLRFSLYDISGRLVARETLVASGTVSLPELESGFYLYSISINREVVQSGKLIRAGH